MDSNMVLSRSTYFEEVSTAALKKKPDKATGKGVFGIG